MNRRKAREYALQILFQRDFIQGNPEIESKHDFWADKKEKQEIKEFAENIVSGTIKNLSDIDGAIQKAADHWDMKRMAAVDRNILRFATYEILCRKDIPSAVTINEALEIAKKYSSSESAPFINGLLDKIARNTGKT
jgi:transcription antitermination protein NusB